MTEVADADPVTGELPPEQDAAPSPALAPKVAAAKRPRATRAPADSSEIAAAVAEAQEKLARAGGEGAFARDPYRIALAGLSVTVGVFPKVVRRIEDALSGVLTELSALVRTVRHPLTDAERAALQRDVVDAVRGSARETMSAAVAEIPRAMNLRSLALVAGGGVLALALVGVGSFYAGRESVRAETAAWAAAQRADLTFAQETLKSLPVGDARLWAMLIRANPAPREAVAKATSRQVDASGRPAGLVPLYLGEARTALITR